MVACGATPVLDVLDDYTISPKDVEAKITSATKAIVPVHLTGRIADMEAINEIAERHNLHVVELCAGNRC